LSTLAVAVPTGNSPASRPGVVCVAPERTPRNVLHSVLRLDDHADAARLQVGMQPVGDLPG
jgi:hypothetical protein